MRIADNLVEACLSDDPGVLYALTVQVFGMCPVHGVSEPLALFERYRDIVLTLSRRRSRREVAGMMDALAWEPGQANLCATLGFRRDEWSSLLTVAAPPVFRDRDRDD
jgi:hypothetical protein